MKTLENVSYFGRYAAAEMDDPQSCGEARAIMQTLLQTKIFKFLNVSLAVVFWILNCLHDDDT